MNILTIVIIVGAIALVLGGILLLKRSASPFKLTKDQWQQVKNRAAEQQTKDGKND